MYMGYESHGKSQLDSVKSQQTGNLFFLNYAARVITTVAVIELC